MSKEKVKLKQQLQQLNKKVKKILNNIHDLDNGVKSLMKGEISDTIDSLQQLSNTLAYVKDRDDYDDRTDNA